MDGPSSRNVRLVPISAELRQGEHPDWGTLVFNFGRHEVANFLLANALYWIS